MKSCVLFLSLMIAFLQVSAQKNEVYDVVVYGATSAGIAAAIEVARAGKTVIIVNPDSHIGGLTTGGLGWTDIGNKMVIGGIAREFYQRIKKYYEQPENWKWQQRSDYKTGGQSSQTTAGLDAMWTFEPSAALSVYKDYISQYRIKIGNNERLKLRSGVIKTGQNITAIKTESGNKYYGKMFVDATYEGDLMAVSKVAYAVGREAGAVYNETLNGVQTNKAIHHQFPDGISPYINSNSRRKKLLPNVNPSIAKDNTGDKKIQAYCFRMCLTDVPGNRISVQKPVGYNELEYELLFRFIEKAGASNIKELFTLSPMPNRKTDTNNSGPFSTDYIGRNYNYPEGNYKQREKIINEHRKYQLGFLWTVQNHARIPQSIKDRYSKWGLAKDEFVENGNWPSQLYIREARRMVSDYVMTQKHCQQDGVSAEQSVGMGAYTMDSHNTQRHINQNNDVKNEGDVQVGGFSPYPIDYRSIIPKRKDCGNLFVPVCLSASHIAYGSIRMEPVFMVLGQSAATAACIAIDDSVNVQDVDYKKLKDELIKRKMVLGYKRP